MSEPTTDSLDVGALARAICASRPPEPDPGLRTWMHVDDECRSDASRIAAEYRAILNERQKDERKPWRGSTRWTSEYGEARADALDVEALAEAIDRATALAPLEAAELANRIAANYRAILAARQKEAER